MKKIALTVIFGISTLLSGCVAYDPYYQPQPVYVQSRPVYIQPRCAWVTQWDRYSRTYRNVRICR